MKPNMNLSGQHTNPVHYLEHYSAFNFWICIGARIVYRGRHHGTLSLIKSGGLNVHLRLLG